MIRNHPLSDLEMDISDAIARHSADIVVAYKEVESQPIYLGYYLPKEYDSNREYPVFVFVHGGGWISHMIFEDQEKWAVDFGQKENYELINCYEDCCDAMDYILIHAKEY